MLSQYEKPHQLKLRFIIQNRHHLQIEALYFRTWSYG